MDAEPSSICSVCGDLANGVHFGVNSCRACAAFYRRSAVANRKYTCRFNGNCEIGKDVRCCCRACRWNKCQALGMRADSVQHHRDLIGPKKKCFDEQRSEIDDSRKAVTEGSISASSSTYFGTQTQAAQQPLLCTPNRVVDHDDRAFTLLSSYAEPTQPPSSSFGYNQFTQPSDHIPTTSVPTPLISEMVKGYRKFVSLQRISRNLNTTMNFNNLLDDQVSIIEGNYLDDIAAIRNNISLVSELINGHFHPLKTFNTSTKWLMLQQFFCQFLVAAGSYRSSKTFPRLDDPRFMITYNHYASINALERFFDVENCKVEPNRMGEIFKPTISRIGVMLVNPMRKLDICEDELCGLLGLLFWNDTLNNLQPAEVQIIVNTQKKIVSELYALCQVRAGSNLDASARFGSICNLVPLTSRLANEVANNFSLANISNAFDLDEFIHLLIPQTF